MKITIKNCNNIKEGIISIEKSKLNIKYGINGTGKSTIAAAIKESNNLTFLKTFGSTDEPSIEFSEPITKVAVFNSDYVNNVVLKGSSIIDNSFEVFIKSDQYDEKRKNILEELKSLNKETVSDEKTKLLLDILCSLEPKLKPKSSGGVYQTPEYKSVISKNNIYSVPEELQQYSDFLTDKEKNINWIDWKTKGFEFDGKNKCPFCTTALKTTYNAEKETFKSTFKKNDVKHLSEIKQLVDNLKDYLTVEGFTSLQECIVEPKDEADISVVFEKFIIDYRYLLEKLNKIINFDSYEVRNSDEISNLSTIVSNLRIRIESFTFFGSDLFVSICNSINDKINNILSKVEKLKAEVGAINGIIKTTIEKSKTEINDFLEIAGFDYRFDLKVIRDGEAKTILKYVGKGNSQEFEVDNIEKHLSWGERNSFSLVLFMFNALSQKSDLIILDDPISSFDGNKKYAIIDRLFSNQRTLKSLRNKTVLMLTHDFEPVIDFVVNGKPNKEAIVHYIKNTNGIINETSITQGADTLLSTTLYYNYAKDSQINTVSRVSFLRKYIELSNPNNAEEIGIAYEILSSLIHGRTKIQKKVSREKYVDIEPDKINLGIKYIKEFISDFDYSSLLKQYYNSKALLQLYKDEKNNYLKSQIFREYIEITGCRPSLDDVVIKFVDEIYHIENDYLFTLDLIKYDTIPNFIIEKIDKFMDDELKK